MNPSYYGLLSGLLIGLKEWWLMGTSLEKQQLHQGYHKRQSWAHYYLSGILLTYKEISAQSYVFSLTTHCYYRQITKPEDEEILQNDINKLLEWAKLWQMNFNNSKMSHTQNKKIYPGVKRPDITGAQILRGGGTPV